MCKVSDKLKLCACKIEKGTQLSNHWILYRYKERGIQMLGISFLPQDYAISKESDNYNKTTLETLLNEGNCFDFDLKPSNKDI